MTNDAIRSPAKNATAAVPLVDLQAQLEPMRGEVLAAITRVVDSGRYILGPEVEALEQEFAEGAGCRHALGVSSGTDALLVALMAIGIGPGDEVITSAYSFFSTAGSIARLGGRPVFVDIEPATFNMDAKRIEAAITPRTKAIVPVHLFGQTAEMEPIVEIARRHDLTVVEDAAQAVGEYDGRTAGSLGDLGCFSFFPTKNLGAMGDAGMVVTDDAELADRVRKLRNHGFSPKYHAKLLGGNFRLDAIQAAVLRVKLKYLDRWNAARRENATRYRRLFEAAGVCGRDTSKAAIELPGESDRRRHIYHQYTIRVAAQKRDELRQYLSDRSIGNEVYYPVPLHLQECFSDLGCRAGDFPQSESAAAETLALPIFAEITEAQQRQVVETIACFFK